MTGDSPEMLCYPSLWDNIGKAAMDEFVEKLSNSVLLHGYAKLEADNPRIGGKAGIRSGVRYYQAFTRRITI